MAGVQGFEVEIPQIISRLFQPEMSRGQEMKPADNIDNLVFPTDLTGIL